MPDHGRRADAWERSLSPQFLGTAVGAAYDAARVDLLASALPDTRGPGQTAGPPVPGRVTVRAGSSRALVELAENMVSSLASAGVLPRLGHDSGTGDVMDGRVSITLSLPSRVQCRVDPRWAQGQSAAGLSNALGAALIAAREELAKAPACDAALADRFGPLLDEVMALLQPAVGGTV